MSFPWRAIAGSEGPAGTIPVVSETPDRRSSMLVEGRRLILDQGFTGTSVDAICEAAGVTKGSFFHYFPSKDEFASQVLEYTWQPVMDFHESGVVEGDGRRRLTDHIRFMARWIAEEGRLMPMIAQEVGSANPRIRDQIRGYFETWMSLLEELLRGAVSERNRNVEVDALKEFIIATTEGIPVAVSQFGQQALDNVTQRLVASVEHELG